MVTEYPCLGFQFLGTCSYNPAQPGITYFDIGSAISALGFILAIQQLFKPKYRFRLKARGIKFSHLITGIFVGFVAVVFAAILPNLPIGRQHLLAYPIFWEVMGGTVIATMYAVTAVVILRPPRVSKSNIFNFVKSAVELLAEAQEEDRTEFANDLIHNILRFLKFAYFWQIADHQAASVEFDRLRQIGAEQVIRGRVPRSAFHDFLNRKKLERANYASAFLRVLSDKNFCSTLVCDCPVHTVEIISIVSKTHIHVEAADPFIQELGRQAILNDDSLMAREVGYEGFSAAPMFSQSLFGDPFIVSAYRPLNKLAFGVPETLSSSFVSRLNAATEMMLQIALKHHGYWGSYYMSDVEHAYENISRYIGWGKGRREDRVSLDVTWSSGIDNIYKKLSEHLETLDQERWKLLFATEEDQHRYNLVEAVASLVFESLSNTANAFEDFNGRFWHHAIGVYMAIYPFFDTEPEGLNPLQQQLAIKLLDKLRDNMNGFYPTISKVLLAVVGPYHGQLIPNKRTAFVIFRDAVYKELQKLPDLYEKKPDKFFDFLPSNVTYDPDKRSLTHSYLSGETKTTELASLVIPEVNFYDPINWRPTGKKVGNGEANSI